MDNFLNTLVKIYLQNVQANCRMEQPEHIINYPLPDYPFNWLSP